MAVEKPSGKDAKPSLVVLFTGDGKGKTTAALGILMRAWGRDLRVTMLQFMKAESSRFGEHRAAERMGVEITPIGRGFTWLSDDLEQDKALALRCWEQAKERIASAAYDIVILDELTFPIYFGWLSVSEVLDALRSRPPNVHIVITGRKAPAELVDFADLVTEMQAVKHPFEQGIEAMQGIDY